MAFIKERAKRVSKEAPISITDRIIFVPDLREDPESR